jgi:hypothetical protein
MSLDISANFRHFLFIILFAASFALVIKKGTSNNSILDATIFN